MSAPLGRCLLVWAVVTAGCAGVPTLLAEELRGLSAMGGAPFDVALVAASAAALTGCAAWLWLVTTLTVVAACRGRAARGVRGCPRGLRRLLLAACGVAVLTAASPAMADRDDRGANHRPGSQDRLLDGLPYPDRATRAEVDGPPLCVTVRPGDSLWTIAAGSLPPAAPAAAVDRGWRRLWLANLDVVGPDPDLIHPGTTLRVPDPEEP